MEEIAGVLADCATEGELYHRIGLSLGPGAGGEPPEQRGRWALQRRLGDLRNALCENAKLRSYCDSANASDLTATAAAIAGGLIAVHFAGINPILVACLIARIGLRTICAETWTKTPSPNA